MLILLVTFGKEKIDGHIGPLLFFCCTN